MSAGRSRLLPAVAALAASTLACLPRGEPPAGRQILTGRQASLAAMVPPNGDGQLRILVMRPHPGGDVNSVDLSVLSLDADDNLSPERLLVSDVDGQSSVGCIYRIGPCLFDKRGRVLVFPNTPAPPVPPFGAGVWVDAVTGELEPKLYDRTTSASGQRSFTLDGSSSANTGTLAEADGSTTTIALLPPSNGGPSWAYAFGGEDFYYLNPAGDLIDLPPSGVARTVAGGLTGFQLDMTPVGPLLTLRRATPDPTLTQDSVVDPVTGHETLLPLAHYVTKQLSPDTRWLLDAQTDFTADPASTTFTLFDLRTGDGQALDLPSQGAYAAWRPGRD